MKKCLKVLCFIIAFLVLSGCTVENMNDNNLKNNNKVVVATKQVEEKDWMEKLPVHVFIDAPEIRQMPELARGCEVTSLSMLLQFAHVKVNKMTLAQQVKKDNTPYYVKDGEIYFGDPNKGFVGNMYTFDKKGFGVFNQPIFELGNKYLPNKLVNLSGGTFKQVYESLARGKPVWVITTSTFDVVQPNEWRKWNTPNGTFYFTLKEHSVLVTGYDEKYLYINNPLGNKNERVDKEKFIMGWEQMGSQAITLK